MVSWKDTLKFDPIPRLLLTSNIAIKYFVRRDLLEEDVQSIEFLWKLPEVKKVLKKQQSDGSWKYPGGKKDIHSQENYNQLETYRQLGNLIEKYGFTKKHLIISQAAEFLFSFQTEEGDFRGVYGTQYTPNYSAAIMELLIKAGYEDDPRIEKGFKWLLSIRQDDGGWVIPIRTHNIKWSDVVNSNEVLQPIRKKSFSHLATGIVLRAFAAHPYFRKVNEAKIAGNLLVSHLCEKDNYRDRGTVEYWEKVSFPFWFTDILSVLDTLYFLGFTKNHPKVKNALNWLKERQMKSGLWDLKLLRTRDKDLPLWITLVICRIFKNFN
jgi:hypothetical protein